MVLDQDRLPYILSQMRHEAKLMCRQWGDDPPVLTMLAPDTGTQMRRGGIV